MTGATQPLKIDVHVHVFSLNKNTGCYISQKLRNSLVFRIVRKLLGIRTTDSESIADEKLQKRFEEDIEDTTEIDRVVILGLDAVYRYDGDMDESSTQFYVPNDYVFSLAGSNKKLLPGPSVNPNRRDAIPELERCIERGAVLIKWLPNTQGFDPKDKRYRNFYKILERNRVPLLSHTGHEHTLGSLGQRLGDPGNLRAALDEGVIVIAAHGGGGEIFFGTRFDSFVDMLRRYSNLYADTSGFALPLRKPYLIKLLRIKEVHHKLVHGSDYPLPISPWVFVSNLSLSKIRSLGRVKSPIERDYLIKKELGFPNDVFTRASMLLKWN